MTEAKQLLLQCGETGGKLAARLGRLSRHRNVTAHPDAGLIEAINRLAGRQKQRGENEEMTAVGKNAPTASPRSEECLSSDSFALHEKGINEMQTELLDFKKEVQAMRGM